MVGEAKPPITGELYPDKRKGIVLINRFMGNLVIRMVVEAKPTITGSNKITFVT